MKKKDTIFDYLMQIFIVYGFSLLCICMFCMFFGEEAKSHSTLFALGSQGLSVDTMLQFFCLSVIITTFKFVLFTDGLIKNIAMVARVIIMFLMVITTIVLFVILFGWFPVTMWKPWFMFFLCFFICTLASTILSYIKEKHENKKIEEALNELKKGVS